MGGPFAFPDECQDDPNLVARAFRNAIRANRSQLKPLYFIARQADSPESLEFLIRATHPIRANRVNRFARITPLRARKIGTILKPHPREKP